MKIDVKDLREDLSSLQLQQTPQELRLVFERGNFVDPVEVELTSRKIGDDFVFTGKARTEVELECSRCLENYQHDLEAKLDFLVRAGIDHFEIEYQDQAEPLIFPGNQFFSIDSLVKETILLNLPLKPLCSEDCKGLCTVCGVNLNALSCQCKRDDLDPRWEKLKNLL